jgi:hypothetical protein
MTITVSNDSQLFIGSAFKYSKSRNYRLTYTINDTPSLLYKTYNKKIIKIKTIEESDFGTDVIIPNYIFNWKQENADLILFGNNSNDYDNILCNFLDSRIENFYFTEKFKLTFTLWNASPNNIIFTNIIIKGCYNENNIMIIKKIKKKRNHIQVINVEFIYNLDSENNNFYLQNDIELDDYTHPNTYNNVSDYVSDNDFNNEYFTETESELDEPENINQ